LAVALVVVLPSRNPAGLSPYLERYTSLGGTPLEVLQTVVTQPKAVVGLLVEPNRLNYLATLLAPLGFLPLLSVPTLALALPDVALNLLSNFPAQYGFQAHYGAVLAPYLVISAILGAGTITGFIRHASRRAAGPVAALLGLGVVALSFQSVAQRIWAPLLDHPPRVTDHQRAAASILGQLPPTAAVAASSNLNPHLSQRQRITRFPVLAEAEYIALDVTGTPYPLDTASQWYHVQQLLEGDWGVVSGDDGILLLRRGHPSKEIPASFLRFARGTKETPRVTATATFGASLQLLGYDLGPGPRLHGTDPYARLALYFRSLKPVEGDARIVVQVRRPDGAAFEQYRSFAATVWYAPDRWETGEVVRVVADRVAIGWLPHASVWLAVAQGKDPDTEELLPAEAFGRNIEGGATVHLLDLERG
jgi:hypothetical protein